MIPLAHTRESLSAWAVTSGKQAVAAFFANECPEHYFTTKLPERELFANTDLKVQLFGFLPVCCWFTGSLSFWCVCLLSVRSGFADGSAFVQGLYSAGASWQEAQWRVFRLQQRRVFGVHRRREVCSESGGVFLPASSLTAVPLTCLLFLAQLINVKDDDPNALSNPTRKLVGGSGLSLFRFHRKYLR